MFSNLAWLRVFTFFLSSYFFSFCYAREESLFTSSVTYCNPPETLLIQRFEVAYFPANTSVSFNVSAASVQPDVNVTANLFLNIYGMNPVNVTLDLCTILKGALCPLPMYNFTGADSITLPKSLSVAEKIPGIAFKIPDLEGFAQLTLTEINTGHVRACVQATLSNGWSAHQRAVEWTTAGVTLATLAGAAAQSFYSPHAILPFRLLELMYLFQSIATSSFLNLNYPSVYRAFAINFAWAVGLISSPDSGVQQSINRMRHLTGGHLPDATGGSAVSLVNRKLSPYNSPQDNLELDIPIYPSSLAPSFSWAAEKFKLAFGQTIDRETIKGEVQTVTADSDNVLQAGLPIYVNSVFIPTANVFTTVFFISLSLLAILLAALALGYLVFYFTSRRRKVPPFVDYIAFSKAWLIRLALLVFFPLVTFIFYQWTIKDSWLPVLLSVISLIVICGAIGYPSYRVLYQAREQGNAMLYAPDQSLLKSSAPLYAQYRPARYYYFIPLLVSYFLKSVFIAFAKGSAEAQLSLMIVVELGLLLASVLLKPAYKRGGDIFWTYLAVTRFSCTMLMIAFLQRLQVKAIPRVVIGIVIAIAWSVAVTVVVFNIFWNGVISPLRSWKRGARQVENGPESPVDSQGSMLEKGIRNGSTRSNLSEKMHSSTSASGNRLPYYGPASDAFTDSIEEVARSRPVNPTPEHNIPMDPSILTPYPISPTATISTQMEPPSVYSRDSATITVGSLLPRRWSFSLSQPGSPMSSSLGHGQRSSMTPSPMPPSPSDGGPALSRNTSVRVHQHQPTHEDIMEEEVATSASLHKLESSPEDASQHLPTNVITCPTSQSAS
ncbi:hypothetical protein CVT24_001590 [Panaeolus cyanescens]|uniref:ML-like domain-containing protein n=1 Tax=Panaeolus cyanescens TaxID=181874 RepID=A0A409YFF3_9AGAR|nr:hypothetical protein CVT24_001590 [Panaeolus cyanescens]